MKINVVTDDKMSKDLEKRIDQLEDVPEDTYTFFRAHTPIRSGRARRSTVLKDNVIEGNYPYAQLLDAGRSDQAPDGMTKPTDAYFKKQLDRILGRK
jgi:hypothetical protein